MVALLYQTSTQKMVRRFTILICIALLAGSLPAPRAAATSAPPPTPAPLLCTAALADPFISLAPSVSPWQAVRREMIFTDAAARVFSAPRAIYLTEDDDGDSDGPVDVDAFRQQFTVPPLTEQIIGSIRYRIVPGALGPNDTVTLSLNVPDNPSPTGRVFAVNIPLSGRADGNWRAFTWAATDIARLAELGAAQLVITMRGVNDGVGISISFDDIDAQVCTRTLATIGGRVTQRNNPESDLRDAQIVLVRSDSAGQRVVATAQVALAEDGYRYQMSVSPLPDGAVYQVWFVNQPLTNRRDPNRLGVMAGPVITSLAPGQNQTDLDLELSTVRLLDPPPQARRILRDDLPVRFQIEPRGIEGETYQICLYDPELIVPDINLPPQVCSPPLSADAPFFDLLPADFAAMRLRYDHQYRWYAIVHDDRGTDSLPAYGYSFAEHTITFIQTPSFPVQPSDDEGVPVGAERADWTVLIYVAADNALGDQARMSAVAQPAFELERLAELADQYPTISLVTFYDGYGNTGGRICAIRADRVDCRRQPEPNSADPATLRTFVEYGLREFPASRTMLVLVGPAHPALGFGNDEASINNPAMSIADLGAALAAATTNIGKRIDLVLMQAPLMGNLNTALALAPAADYLVAPPGQLWRTAWLQRVLPRLVASGGTNPRSVAVNSLEHYAAAVRADGVRRGYALAAFDLARAEAVYTARNALATELTRVLDERRTVIQPLLTTVRSASTIYDSSGNGLADALRDQSGAVVPAPDDAFIDLGDFTAELAASPALQASDLAALRSATTTLANTLGGSNPLVIAVRRLPDGAIGNPTLPPGAGLAEFFPHHSLFGAQPLLVEMLLYRGQTDNWSAFVRRYLAGDRPVGVGGVTASLSGGTALPLIVGLPIAYENYLPIVSN